MMPSTLAGGERHTLTAPLWRWSGGGKAVWFFVTIGGSTGDALSGTALMDRLERGRRKGWGGVRVSVCVGDSEWQTSVFPSKETGWILPVKAAVRKAEGLIEGDPVTLELCF